MGRNASPRMTSDCSALALHSTLDIPMTPQRWHQIEQLYDVYLAQPADAQEAFLDRACADDPGLRGAFEGLLANHAEDPSFLEGAFAGLPAPLADPAAHPEEGDWIGPYRLVRSIGRGGMGQVYLATREDPFRQHVALKVIRRGLDTDDLLARFTYERQILAALDHPNIAHLHDGGTTDDGRPYFAMEYVDGVPLTDYCDAHRLSTKRRLALFRTVCRAVQYAHANLVVHRDLKPSNILVTDDGEVKLLDFGIAKLLDDEALDQATPQTRTGMRLMTPEYASPEQIKGAAITTATDVYQLGVLLYELLTGRRPYRLRERMKYEIERVILEEEPTRPSTAVQQVEEIQQGEKATRISPESVSQARSATVQALQRRLSGDLDNIVLKALKKEPARRYGSVEQLAEDLRRHLAGLPVLARRDTVGYRMGKFARRHTIGMGMGAAFVLLLLGFSGVTAMQSAQIQTKAEEVALERDKAQEVVAFLVDLFETSDPWVEGVGGAEITARTLLDRGAAQIEKELVRHPDRQAEMQHVMGQVYVNMGLYEPAQRLAEQSLAVRRARYGMAHVDVAVSMSGLAWVLHKRGDYAAADSLYGAALALYRELLGNEHPEVANTLAALGLARHNQGDYAAADSLYRMALALLRTLGRETHSGVALVLYNRGRVAQQRGAYAEAEALHREALAQRRELLGDRHPHVANSLAALGAALQSQDQYERAASLYREALELNRQWLGDEHPQTLASIQSLGVLLQSIGDYDAAEPLFREVLARRRKLLGADHLDVAFALYRLGHLMRDKGNYEAADSAYRAALALRRKLLGEAHPKVAATMKGLARLRHDKGDYASAASLFQETLAIERDVLGDAHPRVATTLSYLAWLHHDTGEYDAAEARYRESLALKRERYGEVHSSVAAGLSGLGLVLTARGDYDAAEPLLREVVAQYRELFGEEHPYLATGLHNLARMLREKGDAAASESLFREALTMRRKLLDDAHPRIAMTAVELGRLLNMQQRSAEAEALLREALAIRLDTFGKEDWRTGEASLELGICLAAGSRHDEAKPLLDEGYAVLHAKRGAEDPMTQRARDTLAYFYQESVP